MYNGEDPSLVTKCKAFTAEYYPELDANAVLANLYHETDYISAHRDNEGEHKKGQPIIGFSFNGERKLVVKSYKRKRDDEGYFKKELVLAKGSVYVMRGDKFQTGYTHEIKPGKKGDSVRLSLTIRKFN